MGRDQMMNPAIVIVAFNRPHSLARLLHSLDRADLDGRLNVPLVISVDKGGDAAVETIARSFEWRHGPKSVIVHAESLGLRRHVLWCGDLTDEYGTVIVLEDDLYVSPQFFRYSTDALLTCADDDRIAGVSLYSMRVNEGARRPFEPIDDGNSVYYLQLPSSWGQMWTAAQWAAFRRWYDGRSWEAGWIGVPEYIQAWPETSWKKYFACYLVHKHRFFVYPRASLTTNFGDVGTHAQVKSSVVQVPLLVKYGGMRCGSLADALPVYDAYMEIAPRSLQRLNRDLVGIDFEVDLHQTKPLSQLSRKPFTLTSRQGRGAIQTYEGWLRPREMGALLGVAGDGIGLFPSGSLANGGPTSRQHIMDYDYPNLDFSSALGVARRKFWDGIKRRMWASRF
jgi:hypothetical protein